jgi:hypothetical protein
VCESGSENEVVGYIWPTSDKLEVHIG